MRRSKPFIVVGVILSGLAVAPTLLGAILAARKGEAWVGYSFFWLPIGAYSTLVLFGAALLIGVVALIQWAMRGASKPKGKKAE